MARDEKPRSPPPLIHVRATGDVHGGGGGGGGHSTGKLEGHAVRHVAYIGLRRAGLLDEDWSCEDREVGDPRSDCLGILPRHHLDDLADMVEVMNHPG